MSVNHLKGELLISLPAASPAALHNSLSMAVINSLKHQMLSEAPITKKEREGNYYLLELLETLQPDERQLEKIYNDVDIVKGPE